MSLTMELFGNIIESIFGSYEQVAPPTQPKSWPQQLWDTIFESTQAILREDGLNTTYLQYSLALGAVLVVWIYGYRGYKKRRYQVVEVGEQVAGDRDEIDEIEQFLRIQEEYLPQRRNRLPRANADFLNRDYYITINRLCQRLNNLTGPIDDGDLIGGGYGGFE